MCVRVRACACVRVCVCACVFSNGMFICHGVDGKRTFKDSKPF